MSKLTKIVQGHVLDVLQRLPDKRAQCCITSPPYFGLRDYGTEEITWPEVEFSPMPSIDPITIPEQTCSLGQEKDINSFVGHLVLVFREVRRVLRDDGTLWLNLGDGYAQAKGHGHWSSTGGKGDENKQKCTQRWAKVGADSFSITPKSLMAIPWRVAFALQADGWTLRNDIVWAKAISFNDKYSGSCMPESVRDRATRSHEYIFHLSKSSKYYYDNYAVREKQHSGHDSGTGFVRSSQETYKNKDGTHRGSDSGWKYNPQAGRNVRTVWTINPKPFPEAHFAVFPENLVEPIIRLATSEKGCCKECGTPLDREIKKNKNIDPGRSESSKMKNADGLSERSKTTAQRRLGQAYQNNAVEPKTTGWSKSCDCPTDETMPCLVLDPFSGAGTTPLVAARLRRRCLGVELSEEYVKIAEKRIAKDIKAGPSLWDALKE